MERPVLPLSAQYAPGVFASFTTPQDDGGEAPIAGGPSYPLPIDSQVGLATYGPDGHSIAYNCIFRNFRTWKRYSGGLTQQVYTFDFDTKKLFQVTDSSGTNISPMWRGNRIYYLSDQDANRRANIWVKDLNGGPARELTHSTDYDIDFPALGGASGSVDGAMVELRFFFRVTLGRPEALDYIPMAREAERLPTILSQAEMTRLLEAAPGLKWRTALSVAYGAGLRPSEVWR